MRVARTKLDTVSQAPVAPYEEDDDDDDDEVGSGTDDDMPPLLDSSDAPLAKSKKTAKNAKSSLSWSGKVDEID